MHVVGRIDLTSLARHLRDTGRHATLVKAIDRAAAAGSIREDLRTALDALRQIVEIQDHSVSEPRESSRRDETVLTGALFTQAVVLYARATETQGDRPKLLGEAIPERQSHDYKALDQLRAARRLLSDRMIAKHYVGEISMRSLFFDATERALSADIKALDRRIRKLVRQRRGAIATLNDELSLAGSPLTGLFDPAWPENRYDRGRLTPRGVETCYQLFDMGKSAMAVAHLMDLSLASARKRERMWQDLGGDQREKRVVAEIPKVRIRYRMDD